MLIAKGYRVHFKMKDGRSIRPPPSFALLHDENGTHWPYSSGLVMAITTPKNAPEANDDKAKMYFEATPLASSLEAPPRSLRSWASVGEIAELEYTRRRPHRLPSSDQADYYHPIEKGTAKLYKLGRAWRIELGPSALWNWRGIVRP